MNQKDKQIYASQVITEYMKPIYGFALKKTANLQDAEDLAQEICLKLYKALLVKEDILSAHKFVWTVAHNALANYYRSKSKSYIGNIDDLSEILANDEPLPEDSIIEKESILKLHEKIAYLSKLQRKIIIQYYYSGKKQSEIAQFLNVPLGTVKWHLSEAKSELKKGMETMRDVSELKFNPIKFDMMGVNGSVGSMGGTGNFFRSILSQNIAYCVWKEAKTINEIADCLAVSPVYVESELEFLEEYGFFIKQGNKYLANILIDETTKELNQLHDDMYEKAARLIANNLYDELIHSELLNSDDLYYPDGDKNFLMWSLIFYIGALSGEKLMENSISFEEAATIRPDGGRYIANTSVINDDVEPPKYFDSIKKLCGPCWNGNDRCILWLIDTEWTEKRVDIDTYGKYIDRDLNLLVRFSDGDTLSEEEYAYMIQKGYIKGQSSNFEPAIVRIKTNEMKKKLLDIGDTIKEKYNKELKELRDNYTKKVLENTPKHLRKMQGFGLQYIFYSDGWFMLHCAKELVGNGKLKLPKEEQRKSLTMIMLPN